MFDYLVTQTRTLDIYYGLVVASKGAEFVDLA